MSGVDKTIEHGLSVLREPLVALEAAKAEIERLRTELVSSEEKRKGLHKQSVDLQAEVSRLQRSFEARLDDAWKEKDTAHKEKVEELRAKLQAEMVSHQDTRYKLGKADDVILKLQQSLREGEGLVSLQRAFNEQTNKVRAVLDARPGGSAGAYETMLEAAERVVRERDEARQRLKTSVLHSWADKVSSVQQTHPMFDALQKKEQTLWVLGVRLSTATPSLFLAIGPDKRKMAFPLGAGSKLHPHTRIYGSKEAAMMAAKALSAACALHLEPIELVASTRPDPVK